MRAFSRDIGISISSLSEIMSGKRRATARLACLIVEGCKLDPALAASILSAYQKLGSTDKSRRVRYTVLPSETYAAIADWHHYAVLSLMLTDGFRPEPAWIGRRLGIALQNAEESMQLLERLGCVRIDPRSGRMLPTNESFASSDDVADLALRKSHKQYLEQAGKAVDDVAPELRDMIGLTMAIDPDRLPEAKRMIRKFAERLMRFLEGGHRREVYRWHSSLVPLSVNENLG
jgi:uncharacterized protein (TIGR02147 family)